jgi:hypothetical protein
MTESFAPEKLPTLFVTLNAEPHLARFRKEREDPKFAKSNAETLKPPRTKLRIDRDEPNEIASKTDRTEPQRICERKDTEDASDAKSRMLNPSPERVENRSEVKLNDDPSLAKLRRDKLLDIEIKLSMELDCPVLKKLRKLKELPSSIAPRTDALPAREPNLPNNEHVDPNLVKPRTLKADPVVIKSTRLIALDKRAVPLRLKLDPKCRKPKTDSL